MHDRALKAEELQVSEMILSVSKRKEQKQFIGLW